MMVRRLFGLILILTNFILLFSIDVFAKKNTQLTLTSAVEIAMSNSYRIKRLEMNIERTQHWLSAHRAGLKSRVSLNLQSPNLQHISDYKWDSILGRDVIVRQNTRRWQGDLSIRQPVILFGYPTNGYISLNYKMYRYSQLDNGDSDTNYYNRLYMRFQQPLFMPNRLKNDLERAQLDLEGSTLNYIGDLVEIIEDIGDDYYDFFGLAYKNIIFQNQLNNLLKINEIVKEFADKESSREIEAIRTELEIANARENLLENKSDLRRDAADLNQKLRLSSEDSLFVIPNIDIKSIQIDPENAVQLGFKQSPRLQRLELDHRRSEINVENQKGNNSFRVNLEMTYGLERQDDRFQSIWERYDNSNSVSVNAYIPIWDWGARSERIQAEMVNVRRSELNMEESKESLRKRILNTVTNFNEYLARSLNMKQSVELAENITKYSIDQYENGEISLQDLLQIVNSHEETELKFLDVYLGYKRALLDLKVITYFDFENNVSVLDELKVNNDI